MVKRPILIITIGYIIGIIWELYFKMSIALFYIVFLIILYVVYKIIILLNYKELYRYVRILIKLNFVILMIISSLISNIIVKVLNNKYDNLYKGLENVNVIGTIISNPIKREQTVLYKIKVDSIENNRKYKDTYLYMYLRNDIDLQYGNKVEVNGEYREPEERRNYKGFSYKNYLKTLKIYGSIFSNKKINILKDNNLNKIMIIGNKLNNSISMNIDKIIEKESASFLKGILIGNDIDISNNMKEIFRISNLSHILAISGIHVGYIIMGVSIILNSVKIGRKAINSLTIIFLIFFIAITDFSPSILRACIMGSIMLLSNILYRKNDIINSICVSALILLIYNPFNILDIGFLLSYGGTIGIVFINKSLFNIQIKNEKNNNLIKCKYKYKFKIKVKEILAVVLSAHIIIFPIMLLNFGTISFTFFISNILVSPFLGIIIILGFIIVLISFISIATAKFFAVLLNLIIKILLSISYICSKIPLSRLYIPKPSIISIITYYLIILVIIYVYQLKLKKRNKTQDKIFNRFKFLYLRYFKKIIIIVIILSITFQMFSKVMEHDLKIYFIDVGQGDSTLIISPYNKKILIDGGGSKNNDKYDVGKNIILPYLLSRKISSIDYLMISHFDADHCNGVIYILKNIKVKEIIISKQSKICNEYLNIIDIIREKNIKVRVISSGDKIIIDKLTYIDILHPDSKLIQDEDGGLNNNSIVAKLNCRKFSLLFTGDIEETAEKIILERYKDNLKLLNSDILKIPHHGSKTSSTEDFIKTINPKIALIGVGNDNSFGHPNDDVIERLEKNNIVIYRTDLYGEIIIRITRKRKIKISRQI